MADSKTLHCVKCWWSTTDMHAKQCGRCKSALYLSDGRDAKDVVDTAVQQARAYMAVGYDPAYAPGVVSAAPILAHQSRSEVTWVGAVRAMLVLSWILTVSGLVVVLSLAESSVKTFGISGGLAVFVSVIVALILGTVTGVFTWLAKYSITRAVLLLYSVWLLIKYASVGGYPIGVANLILYGAFSFILVMSFVAPSPYLPGKVRLDGRNSVYAALLLAISVALWSWAAVLTYHESPKVLNQAQITLNS